MRTFIVLSLAVIFAGCSETVPVAEVCDAAALARKVDRFGEVSASLTERMATSDDADVRARFADYAERITAKSGELSKSAAAMPTDAERTERLCRGYDELQAIVDEAANAVRGVPAASNPQDTPG